MLVSDVYRALWRHRLFIVLMTAVVVGAAYFLTTRQTKMYTASSLVRVQQNVRNTEEAFGALLTGERLARTYEQIAETDSVSNLVKVQLRGTVPADAIAIDAAQVSNLELLGISVTYKDPEVAAIVANAVPRALATFIERTGSFRDTITVVERASVPTSPSSPNLRLNLALALLLGLILSAGLALLRDSLSDRIESIEELEKIAGHPVIAVIPNLKFMQAPTPRKRGERRVEVVPFTTGAKGKDSAKEAEPVARWSVRG